MKMHGIILWICVGLTVYASDNFQLPTNMPVRRPTKVIVVGAGAAGLAATQRLIDKNFDVVLLEASSRIGGRIWSRPADNGTGSVELSAEYFPGPGDEFSEWAANHGLLLDSITSQPTDTKFMVANNKSLSKMEEDAVWSTQPLLEIAGAVENHSLSAGSRLWLKYIALLSGPTTQPASMSNSVNATYDYMSRVLKACTGAETLLDVGSIPDMAFVDTKRYPISGTSMSDILLKFAPNATTALRTNMWVKTIALKTNSSDTYPMQVTTTSGVVFSANHVILTVSLGHLKQNLDSLFSPSLSEKKQKAIRAAGFGSQAKIVLVYDARWRILEPALPAFQGAFLYPDESPDFSDLERLYANDTWVRVIPGFEEVLNLNTSLSFAFGGPQALKVDSLTDDQIAQDLTKLLQQFLPNMTVPPPVKVYRAKWRTNPLFLGSNSYQSISSVRYGYSPNELAAPDRSFAYNKFLENATRVIPGLLFAGEATSPSLPGTVSGAVLSGIREANRLLMMYSPEIRVA